MSDQISTITNLDLRALSTGLLTSKTDGRDSAPMSALSNWPRNRLLLALPSSNLKQLMPELERIRCQRDQVLMDADSSLDHLRPASRPDPGERSKDVARGVHTGHGVHADLPKSHVRLRPSLSRAGPGFSSVQRCAQPQAAANWLAAHDA